MERPVTRVERDALCADLLKVGTLTEWERTFVADVLARGGPLTVRQADKLEEIARRTGVARGLTVSEEDLWR